MPTSDALDPERGVTRKVIRLGLAKAESEQLQALINDPAVIAARLHDYGRKIIGGMRFFLVLDLAYTTSGVQNFLASGRRSNDPLWWAAWLVEPMAAGLLILLLTFETEILALGIEHGSKAITWLKRILLFSTLLMNVWPSIAARKFTTMAGFGELWIHALVPVVVYFVAESLPVIQRRMREAATAGYRTRPATPPPPPAPTPATVPAPSAPAEPARPATSAAPRSRLRLPSTMLDKIRATADQAAAEGRPLTAADIQRAVKVPADMAAQIVTETTNGKEVITT